jgi:hypothetical protein
LELGAEEAACNSIKRNLIGITALLKRDPRRLTRARLALISDSDYVSSRIAAPAPGRMRVAGCETILPLIDIYFSGTPILVEQGKE